MQTIAPYKYVYGSVTILQRLHQTEDPLRVISSLIRTRLQLCHCDTIVTVRTEAYVAYR